MFAENTSGRFTFVTCTMIVGETNSIQNISRKIWYGEAVWETWEMGESVLKWIPNIGWWENELERTVSKTVSEFFSKCSNELSSYRPIKAAAFFTSGMSLKSIYLRRSLGKQYMLKKAYHHSNERGLNTENVNIMKPIISYMRLKQHHLLAINNFKINILTNKAPIKLIHKI